MIKIPINIIYAGDLCNQPMNARYFRDALVLDNAKLLKKNPEYLDRFFENLLLGGHHDLSLKKMYQEVLPTVPAPKNQKDQGLSL